MSVFDFILGVAAIALLTELLIADFGLPGKRSEGSKTAGCEA